MKSPVLFFLILFLANSVCWAGELVRINISAFTGSEPITISSESNPDLFVLSPAVGLVELTTINPSAPNKNDLGMATYQPALTPDVGGNVPGFMQLTVTPVAGNDLMFGSITYTTAARFPNNPSSLNLRTSNDAFASALSIINTEATRTEKVGLSFKADSAVQIRWVAGNDFGEFGGGAAGFVNNDIVITDTPDLSIVEGAWLNSDTAGEGILFDFGSSLDLLFLAWFTFTLEPAELEMPVPSEIGFDGQRWMTGLLNIDGNTATGVLRARQAGAFDMPPTASEEGIDVGEVSVEFLACDLARVSYVIEMAGVSGSFDIQPLEKAVNSAGFRCDF